MTGEIRLHDPSGVDLDRHAVIEASAGTGKTYTIERLVLRLIAEKGISLDRILVVTFTEKAAGELRQRVRGALAAALAEDRLPAAPLEKALAGFADAQIFTIHGFCARILRAHAFENGQPFRLDLAEDPTLAARLLKEEMRSGWPRIFGESLEELLRLSGYPGDGYQDAPWESQVLGIADMHRPACGDRLLPEPPADIGAWIDALGRDVAAVQDAVRSDLGLISGQPIEESAIWRAYQNLPINPKSRAARATKVLAPLLRWVSAEASGPAAFLELLQTAEVLKGFKEEGFSILLKPTGPKAGPKPAGLCPALDRAAGILEDLAARIRPASEMLSAYTIGRLHAALRRHKEEHGLLGYEEMLARLDEALDPRRNPLAGRLLGILRERYLWALVDEFQDTDQVQWRIFKRIFTLGDRRLALIGDPKQAIYGFRGADLEAYLGAREELLRRGRAVRYLLPRNWRSRPDLVGFFNALFARPEWFGGQGRLGYDPVDPPPPERRIKVHHDTTGRAPVTVVELPGAPKVGLLRARLAAFVALEIERLLGLDGDGRPRLLLGREGRVFPLDAGHIAVLTRYRREAAGIQSALAARGIPFSHYKQTGLWRSREALHFHVLLAALARPDDPCALRQALLTPFFRMPLGDGGFGPIPMAEIPALCRSERAAALFSRWCELAAARRWSVLFRCLLEESGLLLDLAGLPGGERRISDYCRIAQTLEQQGHGRGLDAFDLAERIGELRRAAGEDDLRSLETEEPRVQIMTIHGAKGLEFPVLFLAGGFTRGPWPACWKFHDAQGRVTRDLARSPKNRAAHEAEEQDEERRLYYVALTRAMVRLYLPLAPDGIKRPGPLAYLVRPALDGCLPDLEREGIARRLRYEGERRLPAPEAPPPLRDPAPEGAALPAPPAPLQLAEPLPQEAAIDTLGRMIELRSFSGLLGRRRLPSEPEEGLRSDDEPAPVEAPAGLPPGPHTGEMLHALLERMPFEEAAEASSPGELDDPIRFPSISALLEELLPAAYPDLAGENTARFETYRRQALELAWPALHTPLPGLGTPLCHIPARARVAEVEFLYPLPSRGPDSDRFLTGVVDLLVVHGGKVWLVDWKSNYLPEGYGPEQIAEAMTSGGYDLQLKIYALALRRWLEGSALEPGGFFFLFLRGLDPLKPGQGVHFLPAAEVGALEPEIARAAGWAGR